MKNINRKGGFALLLAAVMSLGLMATASPPGETVEIPVCDGAYRLSFIQEIMAAKNAKSAENPAKLEEKTLKAYGEIQALTRPKAESQDAGGKDRNETAGNKSVKTRYGTVDWSEAGKGYVSFTAKDKKWLFIVYSPGKILTLSDAEPGQTVKIPLQEGAGTYRFQVAEYASDGKAYIKYKSSFTTDRSAPDLAPYLVSTPYGDYENAPEASEKAAGIWDPSKNQLENVKAVAKWVDDNIRYDRKYKIGNMETYANPDTVLRNGGGVCTEFSNLLCAMLRSQGVPAYVQNGKGQHGEPHAWVMAWIESGTRTGKDTVCSTGAWVLIESTSGTVMTKGATGTYTPGECRG